MGQTHIFGDLSATVNMMSKCGRGAVNVLPPTGQIVAIAAAETDLTRSVRDGVFGLITSGPAAFAGCHSEPTRSGCSVRRFAL